MLRIDITAMNGFTPGILISYCTNGRTLYIIKHENLIKKILSFV